MFPSLYIYIKYYETNMYNHVVIPHTCVCSHCLLNVSSSRTPDGPLSHDEKDTHCIHNARKIKRTKLGATDSKYKCRNEQFLKPFRHCLQQAVHSPPTHGTFQLRYQTECETQPNSRHIARTARKSFKFKPLQGNAKL